jgi:hypothetical protein
VAHVAEILDASLRGLSPSRLLPGPPATAR